MLTVTLASGVTVTPKTFSAAGTGSRVDSSISAPRRSPFLTSTERTAPFLIDFELTEFFVTASTASAAPERATNRASDATTRAGDGLLNRARNMARVPTLLRTASNQMAPLTSPGPQSTSRTSSAGATEIAPAPPISPTIRATYAWVSGIAGTHPQAATGAGPAL